MTQTGAVLDLVRCHSLTWTSRSANVAVPLSRPLLLVLLLPPPDCVVRRRRRLFDKSEWGDQHFNWNIRTTRSNDDEVDGSYSTPSEPVATRWSDISVWTQSEWSNGCYERIIWLSRHRGIYWLIIDVWIVIMLFLRTLNSHFLFDRIRKKCLQRELKLTMPRFSYTITVIAIRMGPSAARDCRSAGQVEVDRWFQTVVFPKRRNRCRCMMCGWNVLHGLVMATCRPICVSVTLLRWNVRKIFIRRAHTPQR